MNIRKIALAIIPMGSLFLGACSSVNERVSETMPEVRNEWGQAFGLAREGLERRKIASWEDAVKMALEGNISLEQAIADSKSAKRSVGMVYRRLLPEITFSGSFNQSITDLDSVTFDDVFLVANGFVSLPNPIEVRAQALQAQLHLMRSSIAGQMLVRELHAQIFRLHRSQISLDAEADRIEAVEALAEALREASPSRASELSREASKLRLASRLEENELQNELRELFGDARYHYRFDSAFSAPDIDYAGKNALGDIENYGQLYSTQAAAELVAMDLSELGVKLADWPRIRAFTTLPSLWSARGENGEFANLDNTRIGTTVTWSTDFRGNRKFRKDQLLTQNAIQREVISQRVQSEANRLIGLHHQAQSLREERERTLKRLEGLAPFNDSEVRRIRIQSQEETNNLKSTLIALDDQIATINMVFWMLDDEEWERVGDFRDGVFAIEIL